MSASATSSTVKSTANQDQEKAILHDQGPLLIIAGPGSGKTFTLVERIIYLVKEKNVKPESFFVVTFTDKAAREIKTRISSRLADLSIPFNLHEMYLGTFHSICLKVLDEYREFTSLERNYSVMDQFDQQYFIYQNIKDYQSIPNSGIILGERTSAWNQSENLLKWVNKLSEEVVDSKKLRASKDAALVALADLYDLYKKELKENNSLDFSTIQLETLRLLQDKPDILEELQEHLKYIMVDEYQDTNSIQEMLLKLLMGQRENICVVGDDDQGLYRFRGASIRNILEFKENFPKDKCKQVDLTTNYRSHPDIISFYNWWQGDLDWEFEGKTFRFSKTIQPPKEKEFIKNPSVIKVSSEEGDSWHEEVFAFLQKLKAKGNLTDWNQVAFLFRSVTNTKVQALARYLEEHGIPVYSPRSNMFFEREEIRIMVGALIFLFPQFPKAREIKIDGKDIQLDIWEYYDRECFKPFTDELRKPENKNLLTWAQGIARNHARLVKDTDYGFSGLFYDLIQFPLFSKYLSEDNTSIEGKRATRNLAFFSQLLAKFEYLHRTSVFNPQWLEKNIRDFFNLYFRFLKEGGIREYEDDSEYAPSGCVSFLTIHQSKGLEFPVVIVGSLEAVPRKQYTDLDVMVDQSYLAKKPFEPMENTKFYDFRRLFYTAFSRAQNLLVLSCGEKSGQGKTPSKHFDKYYEELIGWKDPAFDISKLKLDPIKDVNIKNEYSFTSHIELFETCAQQYRFFKELQFAPVRTSPMIFGTVVHQTIEDIHKEILRGNEEHVTEANIEAWFNKNYQLITQLERVRLAPQVEKEALNHVLRYYHRENLQWLRIKEAEIDVSLVKPEYILKGSIDLVHGEDGTIEIVDFKSEKKPDLEKDQDRLQRHKRQLEIYAHIYEERTGEKVSKLNLYFTGEKDGTPYISYDKSETSINQTISKFDSVVSRIEKKDFTIWARPEGKTCTDCDMNNYCIKNWKPKE